MPSKKSKPVLKPYFLSNAEHAFTEGELIDLGRTLGSELSPGFRIFLDGEMGTGKSTFARALLEGLKIDRPPSGSPTFAIAHEYRSTSLHCLGARVVHTDFYRLKNELELEQTGVLEALWDPSTTVIIEWGSLFPEIERQISENREFRVLKVSFSYHSENPLERQIRFFSSF